MQCSFKHIMSFQMASILRSTLEQSIEEETLNQAHLPYILWGKNTKKCHHTQNEVQFDEQGEPNYRLQVNQSSLRNNQVGFKTDHENHRPLTIIHNTHQNSLKTNSKKMSTRNRLDLGTHECQMIISKTIPKHRSSHDDVSSSSYHIFEPMNSNMIIINNQR